MMKGISITTGGTFKPVEHNDTLDELHQYVDGFIEYVHIVDNIYMICDEEGKLKDKPLNTIATNLLGYYKNILFDFIVGDVLIVGTDGNGNDISLTDEQIETIRKVCER